MGRLGALYLDKQSARGAKERSPDHLGHNCVQCLLVVFSSALLITTASRVGEMGIQPMLLRQPHVFPLCRLLVEWLQLCTCAFHT